MSLGIAIVGCGRMGRLLDQLAPEFDCEVRARFDSSSIGTLSAATLRGARIALEFSQGIAAPKNLMRLASLGVNAVCGTTGWADELAAVRQSVNAAGTALVYSANFSVGVNVFLQTVARAAAFFAKYPEYDAWGWEIHHAAKKDAPSGTLKRLADEMRASGYTRTVTLAANRAGAHPGTHEIGFDSAADTITLRHTARSREGFARGALRAARWIEGKRGVHEFQEILAELG